MEENKINELRIAANKFYLNKYPNEGIISDKEYDKLAKEYESETGKSVKDLVEWEDLTMENIPEEQLAKTIVEDNNFETAILDWTKSNNINNYYLNYKYDGCGIKAVYHDGKLQRIQTTPDEDFGIIRTKAFWNLFPHEVDPQIKTIRGEVLVDARTYGQLSRNKANGLSNSKLMDDEVENEAFIRVYKIQFVDENNNNNRRQDETLSKLPSIIKTRTRLVGEVNETIEDVVFTYAQQFTVNECPTEPIVETANGTKFQVDGVVLYDIKNNNTLAFKFYYTESAITTVTDIIWNQKSNGSYAAVVEFDGITLNDKYICKASSGGVSNMMDWKFGVGAKIKVILANTTIPKIIDVLEPSEDYRFPKCECGYQMGPNDIFGSTLKCGNKDVCKDKVSKWIPELAYWLLWDGPFTWDDSKTVADCILENPTWFLYELHIDRWDPVKKSDGKLDGEWILKSLKMEIGGIVRFKDEIKAHCDFSDLQYANYEINVNSAYAVLQKMFNLNKTQLEKIYNNELKI